MPLRHSLSGIRILDLTSNLPGPLATQMLGDMGADVIKIESLSGDNTRTYPPFLGTESLINLFLNRNKRSLSLNLKSKEGLSIFYKLVKQSDIVIEGFRPGVTERLGIDFQKLKNININIIYCSLIGYKQEITVSGHDINYVGSTGILHLTGPKDTPIVPGVPIGDIGGGSLPTVISLLAALLQRNEKAQHITVSMTEHLIPWITVAATTYFADIGDPEREDHSLSGYLPFYRLYRTKDEDNRFISFAPLERKFWINFCVAIDREDLIPKQFDFDLLSRELPEIFNKKTQNEWKEWFIENDVPGAPVLTIDEVFRDKSRIWYLNHSSLGRIPTIASPFFEKTSDIRPPPLLGEHTKEILTEIGFEKEFSRLIRENIVKGIK
jgi:crotonobetainyl-CoA:carnitine CoA-transferase CaiB-like acyl-CoA transferase